MKKLLLACFGLSALLGTAFGDNVAIVDIKIGKEKPLRRVTIEFYEEAAPGTVANFKKLARKNFYNGTSVHRVFPHQMVQAGDPLSFYHERSSIGTGGPGYNIPAEINKHKHLQGSVVAARLPDKINPQRLSNGSQFYITLTPMPNLDGQYTVFGHVIQGLDVLDAISQLAVDTNDNPLERVVIKSVQIVPRESAAKVKPKGGGPVELLRHVL